MRPALSTRLFARVPTHLDLSLARDEGFLDLELWTDPLVGLGEAAADRLLELVASEGLNVRCIHAPTRAFGAPLDLDAPDDGQALERTFDAMRLARRAGAQTFIVHLAGGSARLGPLVEAAEDHGLTLALEVGAAPHAGARELEGLLRPLGATRHGLCVDLAHAPLDEQELRRLGRRVVWLEVSAARGGAEHVLPDDALRPRVLSCAHLQWFAFEVVLPGSAAGPPGAAELALTLRRLRAWSHAGDRPFLDGYPGRAM
jgi:sugar phosphate isomerase/epimerase